MENISHTKSDTFIKNISFKDSNGVAIDITSSTILFTIKANIEDVDPLIQQAFTITDAENWLAEVVIPAATMDIDIGTYRFDIQWTDSASIVRTVLKGILIITYEIT